MFQPDFIPDKHCSYTNNPIYIDYVFIVFIKKTLKRSTDVKRLDAKTDCDLSKSYILFTCV